MKLIICLAIVCAAIGFSEAFSAEQRKEFEEKLMVTCKEKEGAADDDLKEMIAHQVPTTPKGKCFGACIFETIGIISNGKLSMEGVANIGQMAFDGDAAKTKLFIDMSGDCKDIADADRCELSTKIMVCGEAAAKARGIDFHDLM